MDFPIDIFVRIEYYTINAYVCITKNDGGLLCEMHTYALATTYIV